MDRTARAAGALRLIIKEIEFTCSFGYHRKSVWILFPWEVVTEPGLITEMSVSST